MPTFTTGHAVGGDLTQTDTVPTANLGELRFTNTGMFRYGKASGAIPAGALCKLSADGTYAAQTLSVLNADTVGFVGVPQAAIASGSYGWFFVGCGTFNLNCAAGLGASTKLVLSGSTTGQAAGGAGTAIGAGPVAATGAGGVTACFAPGLLGLGLQ